MSDSKKPPRTPPPDDYSRTTPNIDIPDDDSADWDKTSYNVASEPPADDWGKTVINYGSSSEDDRSDTFDETFRPGDRKPEEPDWGMTQANVDLGRGFTPEDEDYGEGEGPVEAAATQHVIHIPELDRKKFNIPPTPTERIAEERKQKREQGGIPLWFWVSAGLMTMFFFAVIVIVGAYFLLRTTGYEVIVQGAPLGSRFHIDNGGSWGVPSVNNEHHLSGLQEGNRTITIEAAGFTCAPIPVILADGKSPLTVSANCRRNDITSGNTLSDQACDATRVVEDREKCAEQILVELDDNQRTGKAGYPDLERLIKALNWLIINFESNKWDIPEARKRILTKAATHMKNLPDGVLIEIGGHTDSNGSDASNQVLSEKRATAVRDFLVTQGVKPGLLTTKGYGEAKPKASNDTEQGRYDNRRIEYTVLRR